MPHRHPKETVPAPPPFDALPFKKDGPPYNAWGVYGPTDELGRLHLITPEARKRGAAEIKEGIAINLNAPLSVAPAHPKRLGFKHTVIPKGYANDDRLEFNTQCSTQWDGFRHFGYMNWPNEGDCTYYNGMSGADAGSGDNLKLGTDNFVHHPISSRAHLLDIPRFIAGGNYPKLSFFDNTTPITIEILEACAEEQQCHILPGDILIVRTGWREAWEALGAEGQAKMPFRDVNGHIGVDSSEESKRWHWEKGIAAVATDTYAYEAYPFITKPSLHEVFLAGWGLPIGELFELRELAHECDRLNRWTFMFTSMPLYVKGGIASPPNAQAIL